MDKGKVNALCSRIIRSANSITIEGESDAAQIIGICHAAREIAAEVNRPEPNREEETANE